MMKNLLLVGASALILTACSGGGNVAVVDPTLDCIEGMMEYKVSDTPMQFCYDSGWGDVTLMETEGFSGKETTLNFSGAGITPVIKYRTNDFRKSEEDLGFCFNCLRVNNSEADLKVDITEILGVSNPDEVNVRKTDIYGVRGVRVNDGVNLTYYVPGAFDGYNLIIEADDSFAEELDSFVWHMIL